MTKTARKIFDRIPEKDRPQERMGHRLAFRENQTNAGGVLSCSCGWQQRLFGAGNRAGYDYGIAGLSEGYAEHLRNTT